MGQLEKGLKVEKLSQTDYDTMPPPAEKKRVDGFMMKMRSRKSDRVPIKLEGKGPNGYLLQDWNCHRGKGAPRVSETFRHIALKYGTEHD